MCLSCSCSSSGSYGIMSNIHTHILVAHLYTDFSSLYANGDIYVIGMPYKISPITDLVFMGNGNVYDFLFSS